MAIPTRKAQGLSSEARIDKIDKASRAERAVARDLSPLWLRRWYRQLVRLAVDDITSTRVAAVRAEMTARGLELPE